MNLFQSIAKRFRSSAPVREWSPLYVTPETAPYLEAICLSPADDAPRYRYADWLEQQGHLEWAAYLRTHLQLSDSVDADLSQWDDPDYHRKRPQQLTDQQIISEKCRDIVKRERPGLYEKLAQREAETKRKRQRFAELVNSMGRGCIFDPSPELSWEPEWEKVVLEILSAPLLSTKEVGWHPMRRGLINGLGAPESFLIRHGRDLVRSVPLEVLVIVSENRSEELFQQRDLFQHIKSVRYWKGGDAPLLALARCGNCPQLTEIHFSCCELTDRSGVALAQSSSLDGLTRVDLARNRFSAEVATALQTRFQRTAGDRPCKLVIDSCYVPGLNFTSPGSYVGAWGIRQACARGSYDVTELKINQHRIGNDGLAALVQQPWMDKVTWIELMENEIGPSGIHSLTQSPYLRNLKVLVLHRNPLGDEGVAVLAQAQNLPALQRLGCRFCQITDRGVDALLSSALPQLRAINMGDNPITPGAYERLKPRFGDCVNYSPPKD